MKPITQRFERACRRWQKKLLLRQWKITVAEGELEDEDNTGKNWPATAKCDASTAYLRATITVNPKQLTTAEVDGDAGHEMIHIVLEPMHHMVERMLSFVPEGVTRDQMKYTYAQAMEQVTTHLERILADA